jgi:hypothetical protein
MTAASGHRSQGRLVELDQQLGAGHALGHLSHVGRRALGQGTGEVGDRAGVGEHGIERAGQLDGGGQGPGAAQADLERALVTGEDLLDRVEVGRHHAVRGAHVTARSLGDPPAARGGLHRHVDQEGGGAPDQVGARPASGKLGQVGEVR